jgi:hypothetical protein
MVNESLTEEYNRVCWNCIAQLVHSIFVPIITLSILNLWVINWYIYSADSWVLSRRSSHFQWSLCHDLVDWMEKKNDIYLFKLCNWSLSPLKVEENSTTKCIRYNFKFHHSLGFFSLRFDPTELSISLSTYATSSI